jgi:hypothetical protein
VFLCDFPVIKEIKVNLLIRFDSRFIIAVSDVVIIAWLYVYNDVMDSNEFMLSQQTSGLISTRFSCYSVSTLMCRPMFVQLTWDVRVFSYSGFITTLVNVI